MASLRLMATGYLALAVASALAFASSCSGINNSVDSGGSGGVSGGQEYFPTGTGGVPLNTEYVYDFPECTVVPPAGCDGWATRYWDCCKQHCAWPSNASYTSGTVQSCGIANAPVAESVASGCEGGTAFTCWGMAPWAASDTLSYGFAAVPSSSGAVCGKCYQLDFTGVSHDDVWDQGSRGLCGKSMIVQVTNTGTDVLPGQFDILIPGGGVGAFNGCSAQWNASVAELGAQYGGFLTNCKVDVIGLRGTLLEYKTCVWERCQALFEARGLTELALGCAWFVDWFQAANNPAFVYREVECPAELTSRSGIQSPGVSGSCY